MDGSAFADAVVPAPVLNCGGLRPLSMLLESQEVKNASSAAISGVQVIVGERDSLGLVSIGAAHGIAFSETA